MMQYRKTSNRIRNREAVLWIFRRGIITMILMAVITGMSGMDLLAAKQEMSSDEKQVSVLFTHDLHSHFNSFDTVYNGENVNIGGFARLQTLIRKQLEKDAETLIVDAGDFSMGTLFQTVYETQAPELRLLGAMGFEATTFGNHEFDYRSQGVNRMLTTAIESGDELPQLLLCNVDWGDMDEEQAQMKEVFDRYGVRDYSIVEKNGVRIALIGVFGKDALACSPTCILEFEDPVKAVAQTVDEIQKTEDVDMIVCLSHSGTDKNENKSEDEILAKKVPELDLIISGHTHTVLEKPIVHGDTYIVSAGEYGKSLGALSMTQKENGRWQIEEYELIPVTEEIESDVVVQERIDAFAATIDTDYLYRFGYTTDQILAYNAYHFSTEKDLSGTHTEHNLGNIMSDAYVYAVEHADGYDGIPVDVAVVPSGTVRDTYVPGNITVENVFNSFSLGIGKEGIPGYPLISVYLTGEELRTVAEIDASISDFMTSARLYMSGMNMTYHPNRLILNKTTDVYMTSHRLWENDNHLMMSEDKASDAVRTEIEDDRLYRVVADLYSGQMLSEVTEMSYGILSIVPKHADGTPVTNFEDCIVYDGDKELKGWVAIADYLSSFEKNEDGISEIPEYYRTVRGRKNVDDSRDFFSLVKNPNKYAVIIVAAVVVIGVLVVVVILGICKTCQRISKKRNK